MSTETVQVNVSMPDDVRAMLDAIVERESTATGLDMDRSKIVRQLIRKEFLNRQKLGEIQKPNRGAGDIHESL